ncbi:hypothetical protein GCM10007385_23100 [Tateyamaria omphalii]|uniref:calcium-binding protein n=1 Tax=Tateyamaria omphalii TaxID=299262 RepID=UPI0016764FF7|nr:calcium-binding protein [Tateyamaria omphalii]GGX54274.1 hypothetical protein GCM10007385_23100 [Tateyamaria omphalii]
MPTVFYNFFQQSNLGTLGGTITNAHLGTNFLFARDEVVSGSDYQVISEQFDFGVLRYPGGTITERYFDLTDPDRVGEDFENLIGAVNGNGEIARSDIATGLSDFLDYADAQVASVSFVLPTFRYLNANAVGTTNLLTPGAEQEIKAFLTDLLSGVYGNATISHLEIGNEFYNADYDWTDAQFGALQAQIAVWINDVVTELTATGQLASDPVILAQGSNGTNQATADQQNQIFIDAILDALIANGVSAPDVSDLIDGVVVHGYGASSQPLAIGGGLDNRFTSLIDTWMDGDPDALEMAVTEWNVGQSSTSVTGMERNASVLRVFAEMMEAGVDLANIWTVQNSAYSTLSRESPASVDLPSTSLTPTGYIFRMMSQSLQGTQLLDNQNDIRLVDGSAVASGYTFAYSGAQQTVIYIVSGRGISFDLNMDLSGFLSNGIAVNATRMTAVPGQAPDALNVEARITLSDRADLGLATDNVLNVTLDPYELIQVVITHNGNGVLLFGDDQNAVNDALTGTANNDTLIGNSGNDTIVGDGGQDIIDGGFGNDSILGGTGEDQIRSGNGADTIDGGAGHDMIRAGTGNDLVYGGANADNLYGEAGNDTLDGGAGQDRLFGGSGNDLLTDTSGAGGLFGEAGNDTIVNGASANRIFGGGGNDSIDGGGGADTIYGGAGFDTMTGGAGNDLLTGNFNADVFVFADGFGNDTITDFDVANAYERIDFSSVVAIVDFDDLIADHVTQNSIGDAVIFDGGGNSITLLGVSVSSLGVGDFVF